VPEPVVLDSQAVLGPREVDPCHVAPLVSDGVLGDGPREIGPVQEEPQSSLLRRPGQPIGQARRLPGLTAAASGHLSSDRPDRGQVDDARGHEAVDEDDGIVGVLPPGERRGRRRGRRDGHARPGRQVGRGQR
jgi:hypothetical protein